MILKLEKATFEDPHLRGVIVNSHLVKNQILAHYSTSAEKIHVIHNGVEWHEMEADFNASFPHRSDRLELLFVGHNFERKGLLPLLHALHDLKRRDFHLSVVGTDKNIDFYKRTCETLDLKNHVTFYGAQENSRPFYQKADVLVIPSIYDPFANVTVEALAMGLFVVSSNTNGGHEVLTPESGFIGLENLVQAFDHPKTLASAKAIRNSVQYLDYSSQLEKVCDLCLS
jgi:UDP-glucose:(heptosyl)LPS alpha-1,3-glucosyltransferase